MLNCKKSTCTSLWSSTDFPALVRNAVAAGFKKTGLLCKYSMGATKYMKRAKSLQYFKKARTLLLIQAEPSVTAYVAFYPSVMN